MIPPHARFLDLTVTFEDEPDNFDSPAVRLFVSFLFSLQNPQSAEALAPVFLSLLQSSLRKKQQRH